MNSRDQTQKLLELGLAQSGGPLLLLDGDLRIVAGTPGAAELLGGGDLPLGKRAPQILCGKSNQRPFAESLARGESVASVIERPTPNGNVILALRSVPLTESGTLHGHLVHMRSLGTELVEAADWHGIVTASESMHRLMRQVERVAPSNASVLVRGETGAGKELIARAIHSLSPRKDRPFATINCAALPADLLESELFGHVRGAFTGAVREYAGHFRTADGGSIFLDEVAELPLALQAKLLRVTQEKIVVPVGSATPIPVDVRLISATHRSLRDEVAAGRFRADLLFRLRVIPLFLPPLRDRPADIELLVHRFLKIQNRNQTHRQVEDVSPSALNALLRHAWPGNVRELQNVIQYAHLLGEGSVLREADLPDDVLGLPNVSSNVSASTRAELPSEARRIAQALERANGNRNRAAQSLGVSRSTLWRKMNSYNLEG